MHFKAIFRKNIIFFWILICLSFLSTIPKSYSTNFCDPYIQRITLQNYGVENNNYSIIQYINKFIYICNSNGVLQFDGKTWTLIEIKGARAIALGEDNTLFVGALNNFGYLKLNQSNQPGFVSLSDSLADKDIPLGQIRKVFSYKNSIIFCSGTTVYKYSDNRITLLEQAEQLDLFYVNGNVYLYHKEKGFLRLLGDRFEDFPYSKYFSDNAIVEILPYDNLLLVKTFNDPEFLLLDNMSFKKLKTKSSKAIHNSIYSSGCLLGNGNYAIGTERAGIFIMNKNGDIVSHIPQAAGLFNEHVNKLFIDKEKNLWALHYAGLSRIEYPSAYCYYSKQHGINGRVTDNIFFNQTQYIATNEAVYYKYKDSKNHKDCYTCPAFVPINGSISNILKLHQIDNRLIVSSSLGLFEVVNNSARQIYSSKNPITSVLLLKNHPNLFLLGTKEGISAIKITTSSVFSVGSMNKIKNTIVEIAEDIDGTIWLADRSNNVYAIYPFDNFSQDLMFDFYPESGNYLIDPEWIKITSIHSGVLFSTARGVFRFNKSNSSFYIDSIFHKITNGNSSWAYPIMEDYKKNLWINIVEKSSLKNKTLVIQALKDSISYLPLTFNRNNDFILTSMYSDSSGIAWIGGIDRLISINTQLKPAGSDTIGIFLSKIKLGDDSVISVNYNGISGTLSRKELKPVRIDYSHNHLTFEFTSPEFSSEKNILFQYKLQGFDKNWSDWSTLNQKEYKNLREGKYTFSVKAKNIYETFSPELDYIFVIKPPYYRSTLAFVLYLIFISFVSLMIIRWRAYYFARERFKLENIINERTEEVVIQKEKAENLLERVLPKTTATELKSGKKAGPYHYNMVTVLFSDIQGFTKISEQLDSEMLIDELDKFFLKFDSVVDKFNIEKIKTIGDAYMCAGGIPEKNRTNPVEVVLAAIEMQNYMKNLKHEKGDGTQRIWDLRIGIDTGPVVAGVLGKSKITYDIWGGTVNTASRMEAAGEPGKINITENTYLLIKEFFICQYRGKMPVKHKGELDMYFVESFMPHLASDIKGLYPNEAFFTHLQLLRLNDIEEFILTKLEEGLPKSLYYHNIKHTIDVVTQVELIGRSEKISDEDMLVLKTAALFHDVGHLVDYDTHEEESIKLARKILPSYYYSDVQIDKISQLIRCTQMPPKPTNLLEEIMCDADLDYLGRTDFIPVSVSLYKELKERGKIESLHEWNNHQTKFIQGHQYFTQTARKLREVNKNKQLEIIRTEIRKALEAEENQPSN